MKSKLENPMPNSLIAECFSGPVNTDKEVIEKNLDIDYEKMYDKIERIETKLYNFVSDNVLKDGIIIPDIWRVAYEDLYRHICHSQELLGFYVLLHIFYNDDIFSDYEKVLELKDDLDNNFWAKDQTNLH